MSALTDLAAELRANVVDTDDGGRIVTPDGGVIYCAFTGAVKLQRYGLPVVTLGTLADAAPALAAAYRAAAAGAVAQMCDHMLGVLPCDNPDPHSGGGKGCTHKATEPGDTHQDGGRDE